MASFHTTPHYTSVLLGMFKKASIALLSLAGLSSQASHATPWTHNLYFENDLFADTDQSYTNGIRLSWVSPDLDNYLYDPNIPEVLRDVNRWFVPLYPVKEKVTDNVQRNLVFTVGQQMYTPEDRERVTVDPDDRPYAGWLYAGFGYHAKTANKLNSVELNLGVVGPASLAKEAQDLVHRTRGIERFDGWHNQLENEPGIQIVYEHKSRVLKDRFLSGTEYDVITHVGGSLGNVATYVNSGAEVRFGFNLPDDFGTSALRPGGDNSAPGNKLYNQKRGWGAHAFMSIDGRWVIHNIFLDGNSYQDSHSVQKKPFVADAAIGIAAVYDNWKVSFAHVYRTKEFETQDDPQRYGSLSVSYIY